MYNALIKMKIEWQKRGGLNSFELHRSNFKPIRTQIHLGPNLYENNSNSKRFQNPGFASQNPIINQPDLLKPQTGFKYIWINF